MGEGTHPKVPSVHLHEGKPNPDRAQGGQRRPREISPGMPPRTELQSKVSGGGRGTLSDTIELCQQDMGGHPGPGDQAASRVQLSYARASRGPASGSYSLPRDPGWVVWEAGLDAFRCS